MYNEEILSSALAMLGVESEDSGVLAAVCAAAGEELEARLREGVSPEEIKGRFIAAAGIVALSMFTAASPRGGALRSIRAGSLAAEFSGGADADSLRRAGEAVLGAYLRDDGLLFRSVSG